MPLHQWDYLFAVGTMFAALDAYNIGANDVANSFATSIASKSLTMPQAVLAAAVMEFTGAVAVGYRQERHNLLERFPGRPRCTAARLCLCYHGERYLAHDLHEAVSTTYSIVSALAGVGVATGGASSVQWGWNGGKGLATIFAGFIIAPAIAGGFGAVLYLIVKWGVLKRANPLPYALASGPAVFFLTSAVMTMAIIFKGSPSLGLDALPSNISAAAIVGTASVVTVLSVLFWLPYVYCAVVRKDYTPADAGSVTAPQHISDYRVRQEKGADSPERNVTSDDGESGANSDEKIYEDPTPVPAHDSALAKEVEKVDPHPIEGAWAEPKNLYIILRYKSVPFVKKLFMHGFTYDIHGAQAGDATTAEGRRMAAIYERAHQYPNGKSRRRSLRDSLKLTSLRISEVEANYSFVQVLTACANSFAHGANDVSNAIGPFSVIYHVWSTTEMSTSKTPVPIWILVAGGCLIVLGLATYGYNIMKVLGNKITLHSPSRGFSMELGAAITVILASQYGLPVSTTSSTIGVALCNGDLKSINWRAIGWIFLGWVLTVPIVGTSFCTLSGCLMGFILNAPHFTN
ncbi:SPOSA6832_04873 [Sporobolomyces salmonicolor]|uniref:Phosphate transporter n=1 Tax=Sporidiobolus salmonicolor TaxID=5005 RepID=A0A0D6ETS6_SPOSA|nr:SPOSA6832_04873 [Sporobolomyces salmonicolor]